MICYVWLVFSILVPTSAYNPTNVFLINCGANSSVPGANGRLWTTEQREHLPSNYETTSYASRSGVRIQVPYTDARIFRSDFTYSFPVSPGSMFLRLYFYSNLYRIGYHSDFDAANSSFSVAVNGFTLLNTLTVKSSGSDVFVKEFIVPVHQTQLNLTFKPSPNSLAFVNGIEIVSMPPRLYSKGGFNDKITNVGGSVNFKIDSTAFETFYRLNVGGDLISDVGDTGMFRQWLSDDEFIQTENVGVVTAARGVEIKYTNKTPPYVAPEGVYSTYRTVENQTDPNLYLTWLFTVDTGFHYLVRLHLCETLPQITKRGQRRFSIFIADQVAKTEADVIDLSGGSQIPVYLDFSTFVAPPANGSGGTTDLRLGLYPYKGDSPQYYGSILNGIEILKLNDSKGNLIRSNHKPKLNNSEGSLVTPNPNQQTFGGKLHVVVITLMVVGSAIGLVTFIVLFLFLKRRMKINKDRKDNSAVMLKVLLKQYTYAEVKRITKSFSHTIGKGGFGTVYSGNLSNGRKVAVKVLKDSNASGEDFMNEVAIMSQTSHVNIVSLLGFCYEGSKRAIVYEFLENGSLDQFISRKKSSTLDVATLYEIALGTARGLEYLHYGCKTRIVHFDIKPQNILLDDNLCAKVSDFGLAKLCEKRESIVSLIDARGTIGYIAPEVFSRMYGSVSHKSDVYSYGMLVLEMIGARNKEMVESITSNGSSAYFPDWVYTDLDKTWTLGDEISEEDKEIAKKMILVSLWCIQTSPSDRPPMNRIVEMMEGSLDAVDIPPKPSMHISKGLDAESSSVFDSVEAGEKSSGL